MAARKSVEAEPHQRGYRHERELERKYRDHNLLRRDHNGVRICRDRADCPHLPVGPDDGKAIAPDRRCRGTESVGRSVQPRGRPDQKSGDDSAFGASEWGRRYQEQAARRRLWPRRHANDGSGRYDPVA